MATYLLELCSRKEAPVRFLARFCRILVVFAAMTAIVGFQAHASGTPLKTVAEVRALSPQQAAQAVHVQLHGVITYYQSDDTILFIQDATGGIYVQSTHSYPQLHKGMRVVVNGTTTTSFRTDINSDDIRPDGDAPIPAPQATTFSNLIAGRNDCDYVSLTGVVQAATAQNLPNTAPFVLLELRMDDGNVEAHIRQPGNLQPSDLVDARVSLTGVAGGIFDDKYEMLGIKIYVDDAADVHILQRASRSAQQIPVTPMDRVIEGYSSVERSSRVRVRGAVTLYHPGVDLILQEHDKAILIHTHQRTPLELGQVTDVTGFPDNHDYAPSLQHAQFFATDDSKTIQPRSITFAEAISGLYSYNLVSLAGTLVAQVHEPLQDTLVLDSDHHIITAVLRRAANASAVPAFHLGSQLRVIGDCFVQSEGVWNNAVSFNIQMRTANDVAVVSLPSWWTVQHLVFVSAALLIVIVAVLTWAALLRRRVALQTSIIRRSVEDEATRERRRTTLEKERALILEAINSSQPLASVLELIAAFVEKQLSGAACCFRLADHSSLPRERRTLRTHAYSDLTPTSASDGLESLSSFVERKIWSSTGVCLGSMFFRAPEQPQGDQLEEIVDVSYRLAALAIDNRRLYENLVHRSEYDQLTDIPNRFLLESRLEQALIEADRQRHHLAVIYIDLDRFKSVNDQYGHRIGDLYLQQVARRLASKLRGQDMLARIGGDEFLCVVPNVSGREEAECIAERLACSFEHPFTIELLQISGTASIGIAVFPEDGLTGDDLKRAADAAMYLRKQAAQALEAGFPSQHFSS